MTIWKDIKNFEGKYQISNNGQVRNSRTMHVLAQLLGGNGYYKVSLSLNKYDRKRMPVHRIVAETFMSNPDNKSQVNHIDGNPLNNNVDNLEWCTPKENTEHAYKIGLRKPSDHNKGKKLGKTSKYHYVAKINSKKDGDIFRAVVKINSCMKGRFQRVKQFSIKKYGELEAELLAAKAANKLINSYPEFEGMALNVF